MKPLIWQSKHSATSRKLSGARIAYIIIRLTVKSGANTEQCRQGRRVIAIWQRGQAGIFIPDITVEMFRNASLESIEELFVSGEMQNIVRIK